MGVMPGTDPKEVTQLLRAAGSGDSDARALLAPLVYDHLHKIASAALRRERPGQSLQATALVHDAYLRLVDQRDVRWQDRSHFFALAANSVRRILVDHARRRLALKRGGGADKVPLDEVGSLAVESPNRLVEIDDALGRLAELDPRKARVVELRFFGGMSNDEVATVLDVSRATVEREWALARAFLHRELS